jgi:thiamine biosynthesis lipoprotein
MKSEKALTIPAFFLLVSLFASCGSNNGSVQPYSETRFALGTTCSITVYRKKDMKQLEKAFDAVNRVENLMSVNLEDSEISELNYSAGGGAVALSEETFSLLEKAKAFAAISGGAFDPTVGPLVSLWNIGSEGARVPGRREILDALTLVDYRRLELFPADSSAKLESPGMKVDLGAIAKGYAADAAVEVLRDSGVPYAIVNFGGNVYALGERYGDGPWRIGIQDPEDERGNYVGIVNIEDHAVVTSGKYERFFIEDGVRYHHILSTLDGKPVDNGIASVTVIDRDSARADAFSTLLFALGLKEGMRLASETPYLRAVFIMEDKSVYTSMASGTWFSLNDDRYTLKGKERK